MEQFLLQAEHNSSVTCVSNAFIDNYMPSANGEYVKVYLYLLRCLSGASCDCSLSVMGDIFEYTKRDLMRALVYWERMGLLELSYNEDKQLKSVTLLNITNSDPTDPKKIVTHHDVQSSQPSAAKEPERREYTKDEVQMFSDQEDVSELLFIAERYMQRPLTHNEITSFLYWYDTLHFPIDLIEYLVEYCVSREHRQVRYMDKVALAWADIGIHTVEQAKRSANLYSQANYTVIKALGIKGRNLVELETSMIQKWTEEYGFSLEIIAEACNRTISATHQPSFEYTDRILTNWHKAKVKELSDIERLDQDYKKTKSSHAADTKSAAKSTVNRFNNFAQRTYNYEELEKQMLNRSRN